MVRTPRATVQNDDGMTIVELLVAAFLLMIMVGASLTTVGLTLVTSRQARAVAVASATANAQVEEYRTFTFDTVALDDDGTLPATHDDGTGPHPVIKLSGCTDCPPHVETVTDLTGDYTVTRWVLGIDDAADGVAASDVDGDTVDYKRVIVEVAWTHQRGGDVTIVTNIRQDGTKAPSPPQGIAFEILDETGARFENVEDEFPIKVTMGSTDYEDTAVEGYNTIYGIPTGAGFCSSAAPSILWEPVGPTTKACSVAAGQVTSVSFTWRFVPCDTELGPGTSVVTVRDSDDLVNGAEVTVRKTFGDLASFGPVTTVDGVAEFTALPSGIYSVTVVASGRPLLTGELCARPDNEDGTPGGTVTLNYGVDVAPSPAPSPSPTTSPSPTPSPTPTSTDAFEFKWKIKNETGINRNYRMRIRKVGGSTDVLDGPKQVNTGGNHEFRAKVNYRFDYFDVWIECERSLGQWETVFTDANRQAVRPGDTSKNDVKLHEINDIPENSEDKVTSPC